MCKNMHNYTIKIYAIDKINIINVIIVLRRYSIWNYIKENIGM